MKLPIYMDYSATTPVDPRVAELMCSYLTPDGDFGNPASRSHAFGWKADEAVSLARKQVAGLVNADPKEIIWTSGATESDNLAIKGVAEFYVKKGKHIVTSKTEHKAVLDTCRQLERQGYEVTYLDPQADGLIDLKKLEAVLRDDTILVSIMHVNNEIGVIQDIEAIGEMTRARKILFHVDAAQSAGKVPIDLARLKVDLMSFSAHKIYGPKGIGALYVRRKPRVRLEAQMHGGGHERGMRSGTLPTHQIVGMGEAFRIAAEEMAAENERVIGLRQRLWDGIKDMEEVYLNGNEHQRVAGNLNVSFAFVEGESLIMALKDLAVSSGSACTSASLEPSYVLRALGREDELAHSSIRFTLGRFTTVEEVDYAIAKIRTEVERLRELSPLWEMFKDGIDLKSIQWAAH
jgi:cysteine desulfurase